jgi:hypothetical protein
MSSADPDAAAKRRRSSSAADRASGAGAFAFVVALALALGGPGAASAGDDETSAAPRKNASAARSGLLSELTIKGSAETSVYTDSDNVDVVTPAIAITVENPTRGFSVGGQYIVDVVTAASADIIASASPPFREVRHAASVLGAYERGNFGGGAQASMSVEPDYLSLSAGAFGALHLNEKNHTAALGYAFGHDWGGRVGTPFNVFQRAFDRHMLNASFSSVLSPSTLMTVVFDAILERGDQGKPYRYVPLFDEGVAADIPEGASVGLVSALRLHARPLEELPLSRDRFALTGRLAHRKGRGTLRAEERLYIDTWGLKASTTDLRYMLDIGRSITAWPHVRGHVQSGADFWRRAYEVSRSGDGALEMPEIRTGDRELGPLWTLTGGGGVSVKLGSRFKMDLQVDGIFTRYLDALYISRRRGLFTALSAQAVFD